MVADCPGEETAMHVQEIYRCGVNQHSSVKILEEPPLTRLSDGKDHVALENQRYTLVVVPDPGFGVAEPSDLQGRWNSEAS